jgi:hypothetical protein
MPLQNAEKDTDLACSRWIAKLYKSMSDTLELHNNSMFSSYSCELDEWDYGIYYYENDTLILILDDMYWRINLDSTIDLRNSNANIGQYRPSTYRYNLVLKNDTLCFSKSENLIFGKWELLQEFFVGIDYAIHSEHYFVRID